jgi:hypothetical protein
MKRRFLFLILLAAMTASGCADGRWVKPGATDADYRTASYECEKDFLSVAPVRFGKPAAVAIWNSIDRSGFVKQCMEAKGWHRE